MSLRDILVDVLQHYPQAREQDFTGHPLAARIRQEGKAELEAAAGSAGAGLLARGSAGQSEWAEVPRLALFDPLVTDGAQRGYYVVYLLHSSQPVVHLSVNQGTTAVRTEFGGRAREVLADRAAFIRTRIADFVPELPVTSIDLGSTARLPGDYVAGHAMGVSYELASLPEEQQLRTDLQKAISAYRALTFRVRPGYGARRRGRGNASVCGWIARRKAPLSVASAHRARCWRVAEGEKVPWHAVPGLRYQTFGALRPCRGRVD